MLLKVRVQWSFVRRDLCEVIIMEKLIVCKVCGDPLVFAGFASMGSSHSNWYACENQSCERFNKSVIIADEDLYSDEVLRV